MLLSNERFIYLITYYSGMKIEVHIRNVKESIEEIENAVKIGIKERQRTIGFHTSAAAADIFEMILHKENLIDPGVIIKHEWFASKNKIKEKLNFEFKGEEEILGLIANIEKERNKLCYGKPQPEEIMAKAIENFNQLRKKFEVLGYEKL